MCSQSKGIGSANISASMCGKVRTFRHCFTVLRIGGITGSRVGELGETARIADERSSSAARAPGIEKNTFAIPRPLQRNVRLAIRYGIE
jgi:hypothetical protein